MGISVVIIARNEEKHIGDCIKSCKFADEFIVIDDNSTDKTVEIAESLGAKVYTRALNKNFGAQKTYGIEQATQEWVLLIDADERSTPELDKAIIEAVNKGDLVTYEIQRRSVFKHCKASHGAMRPDYVARLSPKKDTVVEGLVHESMVTPYPKEKLGGFMYHYTYATYDQYLRKLRTYAIISAEKYEERNKKSSFLKDIVLRPSWAFIKSYIIDKGFLDGKVGFVIAMNNCFYTYEKYLRYYYNKRTNGEM